MTAKLTALLFGAIALLASCGGSDSDGATPSSDPGSDQVTAAPGDPGSEDPPATDDPGGEDPGSPDGNAGTATITFTDSGETIEFALDGCGTSDLGTVSGQTPPGGAFDSRGTAPDGWDGQFSVLADANLEPTQFTVFSKGDPPERSYFATLDYTVDGANVTGTATVDDAASIDTEEADPITLEMTCTNT